MDIYVKQEGFNQFYAADCVIIRTKKGNIRVLLLSVEKISSRKYYRQPTARRIILPVCPENGTEKFFTNGNIFIPGTAEYNFFDSISKSIQ